MKKSNTGITHQEAEKLGRKDILKKFTVAAGALTATAAVSFAKSKKSTSGVKSTKKVKGAGVEALNLPNLNDYPEEVRSDYLRMINDLKRALRKPIEKRRWGMAIHRRKCVGCNACTTSCISENALPSGVVYRPVVKTEIGEYPNLTIRNTPKPCMQCENPPCVPVCPVGATYIRPDGVIEIDYKQCIGCRYCLSACPYEHRMFDMGRNWSDGTPKIALYDKNTSFDWQKEWKRSKHASPIGNARKCTFCVHRLEEGALPSCVTTCIGGANYFGDLNDPKSLISEIVHRNNVIQLKEEAGTKPKVFYLL